MHEYTGWVRRFASGAFQMINSTYQSMINEVAANNPGLNVTRALPARWILRMKRSRPRNIFQMEPLIYKVRGLLPQRMLICAAIISLGLGMDMRLRTRVRG